MWLALFIPFIVVYILYGFQRQPYLILGDELSYFAIAEHYARGHFQEAINSYWSPLFSIELAILYKLGFSLFEGARMLNLISFFVILYFTAKISIRLLGEKSVSIFPVIFCIEIALFLSLYSFSLLADVPSFAFFLALVYHICFKDLLQKPFSLALLHFACFFSKYAFLFICLIPICILYIQRIVYDRKAAPLFIKYLLAITALTFSWLALCYSKYGLWEITSSASYNFNVLYSLQGIDIASTMSLAPKPHEYAYFSWEDLPLCLREAGTYNYESDYGIAKGIDIFQTQIVGFFRRLKYIPIVFFGLILGAWSVIIKRKESNAALSIFLFATAAVGIYSFVLVEERYILGSLVLLAVLCFTNKKVLLYLSPIIILSSYLHIKNINQSIHNTAEKLNYTAKTESKKQITPFLQAKDQIICNDDMANLLSYDRQYYINGNMNYYTFRKDTAALYQDLEKYEIDKIILSNEHQWNTHLMKKYRSKQLDHYTLYYCQE